MHDALREAVERAATREEARAEVAALYAQLQGEIDQRRPRCVMSGRCCHFEAFGHRLYVTTVELAAFLHEHRDRHSASGKSASPSVRPWDGTGCPFQSDRLCGVH